ncbi:helix-turn-helix domain-containing protein [Flavobacterium sp.]|uniref:helix-turn-helix domain-containing protein n=1 Tax=Flavobacterium sp. TaxID=239 RepID=UPI002626DA57|nr:helix-turn-helix domain-containing protein [Flavobacterium sp.]MDD2984879.1 helix-turn-helix domain-containing protein [Flavobacterium sp.]
MEITKDARHVLQFINQTQQSIFLTGKAGTGKTTLLRIIIETTHKNTVVVAPTGIAALNAGGVTIHSMFQLPLCGFIPEYQASVSISNYQKFETKNTIVKHFKMSGQKKNVLQNMELLIIDEVSMLRADLLDAIDFTLRKIRKNDVPFGGVQLLFIGDLQQLPPVVKNEEWQTLRNYYRGIFFFNARVIQEQPPLYVELSKIFRQSDERFIGVLNNLRNNQVSQLDVTLLNQFVQPDFDLKKNKGYITLTTHNAKADQLNYASLNEISEKARYYKAEILADFPEKIYPVEAVLELKVGAQIMFIKNDLSPEKKYFNGKMGFIKSLSEAEILVFFPEENKTIEVEKYEWKNIRYSVNATTKEIDEEVIGTFVHYPIKLAWAITVHKSQGLTFEKAVLDVSQVFLPGQAYVALSRLRSLDGLILLKPIQMNGISNDENVMQYAENKADEQKIIESLQHGTKQFIHQYIKNSFDWVNLAQEWRNHRFSYLENTEKSEKTKHQKWAEAQEQLISELVEPSKKFRIQLDRLFLAETVSYSFIEERLAAAYAYFYPKLDQILFDLLFKMEEIKRIKRVKEYYQELYDLEEKLTTTILRLLKAVKLLKTMMNGDEINKVNLSSDTIRFYKTEKLNEVLAHFKKVNQDLIEDELENQYDYLPKKKKAKTDKKSTLQETLELWQQQKTISEIAKIRLLTTQTIYGHLGKLIQAGTIEIQEVMPGDKIEQLTEAFYGYKEESLNSLKEQVGDRFTWDELRLFKASLN